MALPESFLQELRNRISIMSIIGRQIRLERRGRDRGLGLCPFHSERTPSFHVDEARGRYHCFGCGADGDAIAFLMHHQSLDFREAIERLAHECNLDLPQETPSSHRVREHKASLIEVIAAAARWFHQNLNTWACDYLRSRGINEASWRHFVIGVAPNGHDGLIRALPDLPIESLIEAGLVRRSETDGQPYDFFRNRLILPIRNISGQIVGFGGRRQGEQGPKYINSPETPVFSKRRLLFGLDRTAIRQAERVIVVEGYFDVITLHQEGYPYTVSPLGTALDEALLRELWRYAPQIFICLDGDAAGRRAAYHLADRALEHTQPGRSLNFAFLPEGTDPADLVQSGQRQELDKALTRARPLVEMIWSQEAEGYIFETPEARADLRRKLKERCTRIGDPLLRDEYRRSFAQLWQTHFPSPVPTIMSNPHPRTRYRQKGPPPPHTSLLRKGGMNRLHHRFEGAALAALIHHPNLADLPAFETLAHLEMVTSELIPLRDALIDILSEKDRPMPEDLIERLSEQLGQDLLDSVLCSSVYSLFPFARSSHEEEACREPWSKLIGNIHARGVRHALHEETKLLISDMNKASWERFLTQQDALENC